jgi:hypothetical protein
VWGAVSVPPTSLLSITVSKQHQLQAGAGGPALICDSMIMPIIPLFRFALLALTRHHHCHSWEVRERDQIREIIPQLVAPVWRASWLGARRGGATGGSTNDGGSTDNGGSVTVWTTGSADSGSSAADDWGVVDSAVARRHGRRGCRRQRVQCGGVDDGDHGLRELRGRRWRRRRRGRPGGAGIVFFCGGSFFSAERGYVEEAQPREWIFTYQVSSLFILFRSTRFVSMRCYGQHKFHSRASK